MPGSVNEAGRKRSDGIGADFLGRTLAAPMR